MSDYNVGKDVRGVHMRKPRKKASIAGSEECVCPKCGFTKNHPRDSPCERLKCPTCNVRLRENK